MKPSDFQDSPKADHRGEDLLQEAAAGDAERLAAYLDRYRSGEPAAYIAGYFRFDGLPFKSDRRAYITDPELVYLLAVVERQALELERKLGRAPRILEFGVGAGTLSITLKHRHPHWDLTGLDIDADALVLARENADTHGCPIRLLQSDYFSAWPMAGEAPDLIFADPPWGGPEDLYDETRGAAYYEQMPVHSAFPKSGGPSGIHDRLIVEATRLAWPSMIALNYGVLPRAIIERSARPLASWNLIKAGGAVTVLLGQLMGKT